MRIAVVGLALVGCGRIGFDGASSDAASRDVIVSDTPLDVSEPDAVPAVCGNAVCEGTLGETCGACMSDCAVQTVVCGNGACETSEDGTTCYADCGPTPWPWAQEESDLFSAINSARVAGVQCPGDSAPRFGGTLLLSSAMQAGTREHAWEIAHHEYSQFSGMTCNGRTYAQRQQPYAGNGGLSSTSTTTAFASATLVVDGWKTDATLCPILMTAGYTQASVAAAHDGWHGYVAWFK
ncbi:MAG TPA: hypothetical protein VMZ53_17955 [Kofleriaceae bacterium]|nr:hypothetical protein [Kofleriaceae bacterium]